MTGPAQDPMGRALDLAALGHGRTAPNPPVGAVVVRDGRIVGEGHHAAAGEAHAETIALVEAGPLARDATLYVTLEPCCHHGRTTPCTDTIIAAGIVDVRYALKDPDPRVAGGGHHALVEAGVRVEVGASEGAAKELLRGYLTRRRLGRSWVTAKYAMSERRPRWGKDKLVVLLRREGLALSTSMVKRIPCRLLWAGDLREPARRRMSVRQRRWRRPYAIRKPADWRIERPGDVVELDTRDLAAARRRTDAGAT